MKAETGLRLAALQKSSGAKADARAVVASPTDQVRDPWQLTSAISACSARSLWREAVRLLCQSRRAQLQVGAVPCNAGMSACQKGLAWTAALSLLTWLCTAGTQPDTISLNTCIGASKGKSWRVGIALVSTFAQGRALQLDCFTLTGLLRGCRGNWPLATDILVDLCQHRGMQPSTEVSNAHLSATLQRKWPSSLHLVAVSSSSADRVSFKILAGALSQSGTWQGCVRLLQLLRLRRFAERATPLSSLVSACGQNTLWRRAVGMLFSFQKELAACSATISACSRASCWKQALDLSDCLATSGLRADIVSWNAVLGCLAPTSKWTAALRTFRVARRSTLRADVVTFGATVEAASAARQWAELLVLLTCHGNHRGLDVAACSSALRGLTDQWKEAALVLRAAVRSALRPDLGNVASLVSALPSHGWQQGVQELPDMPTANTLSSTSYLSLSAAVFQSLRKSQNWSVATVLFSDLCRRELVRSEVLANAMACLHAAGRREQGLELCRRAQQDGVRLDTACVSVVLSLCDRADFWHSSLHFLTSWAGKLDRVTLGAAVASCSTGAQWLFCTSLLQRYQEESSMSLATINSLIDATSKSLHWHVVLGQLAHLRHDMLEPDLTSVNSALASFTSSVQSFSVQAWARAVSMTSRLQGQKDAITSARLLEIFEESGCWIQTVALLDELIELIKTVGRESRSQAVACMDQLLDNDKLHISACQKIRRFMFAPLRSLLSVLLISRLDQTQAELEVYSLGCHFTHTALSQLGLAPANAFWLPHLWWETRRSCQRGSTMSTPRVASARLVTASEAHAIWIPDVAETERNDMGLLALLSGRQRTLGHRTEGDQGVEEFFVGNPRLAPVFVDHDRSLHAERQALLVILCSVCALVQGGEEKG